MHDSEFDLVSVHARDRAVELEFHAQQLLRVCDEFWLEPGLCVLDLDTRCIRETHLEQPLRELVLQFEHLRCVALRTIHRVLLRHDVDVVCVYL
jgi:hypothetical protein